MNSMTGFGFGEGRIEGLQYSLDLKSYNNRYLDLILSLPPHLAPREAEIRDWLASRVLRGRVEFTVRIKESSESLRIRVNEQAVRQYRLALDQVLKIAGLKGRPELGDFIQAEGVFTIEKSEAPSDLWERMETVREKVLTDFLDSREREGRKTAQDIAAQLAVITEGHRRIQESSGRMEIAFRENLTRRFAELQAEVDENRLLSEIALLLMRYGINEELVRLKAHLGSFQELAASNQGVGKKLDFLCQEIGREINTIGSKTTFAEVQQIVVNMKDAMENIREQLRNVE